MSAIRFDNVSKVYDLKSGSRTILGSLRSVLGRPDTDTLLYALRDISFSIQKGEAFGIIGRNGAGKSTLLKVIAGITKQTSGDVHVAGLVSSLIELGAGFHPDLTGRENIYMSGALLGIPRKKMDEKFNEIVDFAELWKFIDVPIKKYSSGMYARLGFSVAVSIEPEILIVDEILSVGDIFFQQKCFAKMREIQAAGTTFIFVTHDTNALQNLCDRVLLLEGGVVEFMGDVNEAVNIYYAKLGANFGRGVGSPNRTAVAKANDALNSPMEILNHSIYFDDSKRHGDRGLEIVAARVTNNAGIDTTVVKMVDTLHFHLLVRANEEIPEPLVGLHLYDRLGTVVFAAGTPQLHHALPSLMRGQSIVVQFDLTLSVSPGEYSFSLLAAEPSVEGNLNIGFFRDQVNNLGPIQVTADYSQVLPFYGVAQLPFKAHHGIVRGS